MSNNESEGCNATGAFSAILSGVRKRDCRCAVCAAYKSLLTVVEKLDKDLDGFRARLKELAIKPCGLPCQSCSRHNIKHFSR